MQLIDKDLLSMQEVRELVEAAKEAQQELARMDQAQVDRIVRAIADAGVRNARRLAQMANEDTGFGIVDDKVIKNIFASRGVYEHIKDMKTIGEISRDDAKRLRTIAVPVGVIAGLIPSTNPTSTALYKAEIAIKAGNAIVFSPHPTALRCILETVKVIRQAVAEAGGNENLVSCITIPTMEATDNLMRHRDVAMILATGGFGANDAMVPEAYKQFVYAGHAGATGDGLKMAEAVNADTFNMEFVNTQPNSMILPSGLGQYCNPGVGAAYSASGAFLVNQDGVRFANEKGNAWDLMQEMKKNSTQYLIMDQTSFDAFNKGMTGSKIYSDEDVEKWLANDGEGNPFMVKADSLEDLAKKMNLPEGALTEAAAKFNETAAKGEKDEFGRELTAPLSEEGPYYALQQYIRYYATLGGLRINDGMQVLNTEKQPVEGLYAAGEVVGGLEGDVYMGATLFGWAVTSGYNAGNAASAAIAK